MATGSAGCRLSIYGAGFDGNSDRRTVGACPSQFKDDWIQMDSHRLSMARPSNPQTTPDDLDMLS